jgi:hypothetical protein
MNNFSPIAAPISYHTSPTPVDENTVAEYFLVRLRPLAIEYHLKYPLHEVEDYINMGIMNILYVMRTKHRYDYAYLYGVARLTMKQASYGKAFELSLDSYLYNSDTDMHHDVEDVPPAPTPIASQAVRIRINRILKNLEPKHRAVLLSYYGIQDRSGRVRTPENVRKTYKLTKEQYFDMRKYLTRKLSVKLQ